MLVYVIQYMLKVWLSYSTQPYADVVGPRDLCNNVQTYMKIVDFMKVGRWSAHYSLDPVDYLHGHAVHVRLLRQSLTLMCTLQGQPTTCQSSTNGGPDASTRAQGRI